MVVELPFGVNNYTSGGLLSFFTESSDDWGDRELPLRDAIDEAWVWSVHQLLSASVRMRVLPRDSLPAPPLALVSQGHEKGR